MILQTKETNIENTLGLQSEEFDIEKSAKMFSLFSDKIYSYPIRAILRELCCNAIDAHIDSGNTDPIHVFLPTESEPTLVIQDFGIGMTNDDIMKVYKSYGKSTKDSSDKLIGALGLGGKTPFAYTDQFTLSSSRDGTKNYYLMFRNEDGIPNVSLLKSEPSNESGTTVSLSVKREDITQFAREAFITFIFFNQLPLIERGEDLFYKGSYYDSYTNRKETYKKLHEYLQTIDEFSTYSGMSSEQEMLKSIIERYSTQFGVIMGQVFYTVDRDKLFEDNVYGEYTKFAYMYPGKRDNDKKICKIPNGSVSFQPSREALNYSSVTRKVLDEYFLKSFNEYASTIESIPTSQEFIDKINDLDADRLSELHKTCVNYKIDNDQLKKIVDAYTKAIETFFANSAFTTAFVVYRQRRNIQYRQLSVTIFEYQKEIFTQIMTRKYDHMLEVDNPKCYEKLLQRWIEKKPEKNTVLFPSLIEKYLDNLSFDRLICAESFSDYFKIHGNLKIAKLSDYIKKFEDEHRESPREKTERTKNTDGKCWNAATDAYVSIDEVADILSDGNEIAYELFEGTPRSTGYYFEPNFTHIGKKDKSIEGWSKGNWFMRRMPVMDAFEYQIKLPKNYLYCDYTFFRKNELWNLSNVYFYKDYFLKELIEVFTKIRNALKNPSVWGKHLFSAETHTDMLDIGTKKYGKSFALTSFGADYQVMLDERKNPQTKFGQIRDTINEYMTHSYFNRKDNLIPQYNQLAIKLKEYSRQLLEELNKVESLNPVRNYYTEIDKKYPMLQLLIGRVNDDFVRRAVDYIALIDGLKEEV
jgi:hypothetical protein